jgi:Flp pilus assembly protein TadB
VNLTLGLLGLGVLLLPGPRRLPPGSAAGSLPLALDLVAAALRAGQPFAGALEAAAPAAPAADAAQLRNVAALLRLGADPPEAWAAADGGRLSELSRIAARSSVSGARLADACAQYAVRLRRAAVAADEARAQRAGVLCAAPLAICFLPAFVCIGVVPTIAGLAESALHGL